MAAAPSFNLQKRIVRFGEQALWSSFAYPDTTALASTSNRTFVTPRGSTGQGFAAALSRAETNMEEGGRIPGGYAYTVGAIALQPYYLDSTPICGADIRNVTQNCVLIWTFLQVEIVISHATLIGAGGGIFGTTNIDPAAPLGGTGGSSVALNNGAGQLWNYQVVPVELPANTTFALVQEWGSSAIAVDGSAGNSTLVVRNTLLGVYKSAIPVG